MLFGVPCVRGFSTACWQIIELIDHNAIFLQPAMAARWQPIKVCKIPFLCNYHNLFEMICIDPTLVKVVFNLHHAPNALSKINQKVLLALALITHSTAVV